MAINGAVAGRGHGRDILGHPLEALAGLANSLAARGRALRAGEFVLLGSLVATKWMQRGDEAAIEIEGLGRAAARFVGSRTRSRRRGPDWRLTRRRALP